MDPRLGVVGVEIELRSEPRWFVQTAEVHRGDERFTLRFEISGPALPAPAR